MAVLYNMHHIFKCQPQYLECRHWFYWAKFFLLSHISGILTSISRINEPIPGMFVLNWNHFSRWFQILSWISKMLIFVGKFCEMLDLSSALACRVLSVNEYYTSWQYKWNYPSTWLIIQPHDHQLSSASGWFWSISWGCFFLL